MHGSTATIPIGFRLRTNKPDTPGPVEQHHTKTQQAYQEEESWILCRQCRQRISRTSEGISVNGSHQHTFANPSGIVFEIVCYRNTTGCRSSGVPSSEFTWFSGHAWQIVICGRCLTHLGWRFISNHGEQFYGLILDRIETGA